jgi:hypothetical protein
MIIKVLGIVALAVLVLAVGLVTDSCQFAGPVLSVYPADHGLHIEGRFLGEYSLDFERVRIDEIETGAVICDLSGRTTADIDLVAGVNTPPTMFQSGATVVFRVGSDSCRLVDGKSYRVTAWGNNGWGNVRASSVRIQF